MTENTSEKNEVVFAHPSEQEFSRILDFYQIEWEYEPTCFPLEWDEGGQVVEAFSPDFYLPQYDLYIELTTMRQKLVTKKHHKIRRLQELHPKVHIKLVNRRAFGELLVKYGLQHQENNLIGQAALDNNHE